ncbi:MAG: ABC transporter ATP-binding protein [Methyloligellaceae bacterium]
MDTRSHTHRTGPSPGWGTRGTAGAAIAAHLRFDSVSRHYGGVYAVRDVSLEVEPGEILCLLGPSGCGKTTLLRLTAGVERPTGGSILIDGRVVSGPEDFVPPEKRGVALMFQDFALFPHLTLLQNVAFGLRALSRSEASRVAHAALERVGLADYADDYPHILSGGQQQRVALARAIAPRPRVLLMDEPFSGLDTQLREEMREQTLAILRETGATCMIVTHSSEEAMRMGNRIALMRTGQLVQTGTAQELYSAPRDLGVARMFSDLNEIACLVRGGESETPLGRFPAKGVAEGAAVLCIRHRDVKVVAPEQGRPARVIHARFLGETALLELSVEGVEESVFARVRESQSPPEGSLVGVQVRPENVLVFGSDQEA